MKIKRANSRVQPNQVSGTKDYFYFFPSGTSFFQCLEVCFQWNTGNRHLASLHHPVSPPVLLALLMFLMPQLFQNGHIFCIVSISSFPPHPHQRSSHLYLLRDKIRQWFVLDWHLTDQRQATGHKTRRSFFVEVMLPKKTPKSTTDKHWKSYLFLRFLIHK